MSKDAFPLRIQESERDIGGKKKGDLSELWVYAFCGQSGAIAPFPKAAGAASALTGFLMMLVAFGAAYWVGARMDGSAMPMIVGIAFCSAAVAFIAWVPVQRVRL